MKSWNKSRSRQKNNKLHFKTRPRDNLRRVPHHAPLHFHLHHSRLIPPPAATTSPHSPNISDPTRDNSFCNSFWIFRESESNRSSDQ
jgi:hypothetical protein